MHQYTHWCRPFESLSSAKENSEHRKVFAIFWQRMRDSNPRKRSQSPVCYRYTNPLCDKHGYYYIQSTRNVKHFFPITQQFSFRAAVAYPERSGIIQHSQGKGFPLSTWVRKYRKVFFSPSSRSIVRIYSSSCFVCGCISRRSRLFSKYSSAEPGL